MISTIKPFLTLLVGVVALAPTIGVADAAQPSPARQVKSALAAGDDVAHLRCRFSDARLTEISGITWSRRHPGVYWVHNDSGKGPYIYAVDGSTCRTLARVRIGNIGARDIEAIATGTDPSGRGVLWVGDIGDNRDSWPSVRLHAVIEPESLVDQQIEAVTYLFTYADMPHNAESILAEPGSARIWVVTKQLAAGGIWRVALANTATTKATRIGGVGGLVTDAAFSPDGTRFVVRDYVSASLFQTPVSAASLASPIRIDLPLEPQGEAITFTADGQGLLVASERESALWWVPLPGAAGPSVTSASVTASVPSAAASGDADAEGEPIPGPGSARVALAVVAVVAALVVSIAAARRLRR